MCNLRALLILLKVEFAWREIGVSVMDLNLLWFDTHSELLKIWADDPEI